MKNVLALQRIDETYDVGPPIRLDSGKKLRRKAARLDLITVDPVIIILIEGCVTALSIQLQKTQQTEEERINALLTHEKSIKVKASTAVSGISVRIMGQK